MLNLITRLFPPSNAVTEGPSPKVTVPAAILAGVGVLLIVAAFITGDDELAGVGVSVLASSGVVGVAGAAAGPGSVITAEPVVGRASDDVLAEHLENVDAPGAPVLNRPAPSSSS